MISSSDLQKLKRRYEQLEQSRRDLQRRSADAQRLSKLAIFSIQREDFETAQKQLDEAEAILREVQKMTKKEPRLASEGMWRSALEEYGEAEVFLALARGAQKIKTTDLLDDPAILLGAISDAVGELVRLAVRAATNHDRKRVEQIYVQGERLVEFLTSLDLTGGLRSKGDQARQHLRRLEDIRYDMS
jgi:predicted translin family RNA/ssDNA-binding protein